MASREFEFFKRYEALRTDDYLVEFDEYRREDDEQMMIAHIRVFRWAPSVLKSMLRWWASFRQRCAADFYASPQVDEPRWHKFVAALGCVPLTTVRCLDGLERPIYINRMIPDGHEHINHQFQQQQLQHQQ